MGETTGIQWATATWNPWIGCDPVSEGCRNCYAAAWAKAKGFAFRPLHRTSEETQEAPLRWRKSWRVKPGAVVMVCSLSDFWHEAADEWRADAWRVMAQCPEYRFVILTKRPERMAGRLPWAAAGEAPWPNVWLGTTVENPDAAGRLAILADTPAALRVASVEPCLGPLTLAPFFERIEAAGESPARAWAIAGGESGVRARPMHPDWVRRLRDECAAAGVPFCFKQWGEWAHREAAGLEGAGLSKGRYRFEDGTVCERWWRGYTGRQLDGCELDGRPSVA